MTGDALGLPREGLSARRARLFFGETPTHAFLPGRGMTSDDSELAFMTAQALLSSRGETAAFESALSWRLRGWLLTLPAGIGLATLRSAVKLWLGFPPRLAGVFSAGNGPALRAPLIGLYAWDDERKLEALCAASTRLTHTDPKAQRASFAAALACRYAALRGPGGFSAAELVDELVEKTGAGDADWSGRLRVVGEAAAGRVSREEALRRLDIHDGVSGYIYHTVPAALWAWLPAPFDFAGGMARVLALGGDADTAGAVFGALCGAATGVEGVPAPWQDGITDFPRGTRWARALAGRFHARGEPLGVAWPLYLARGPLYWAAVLAHGLRRLLPPY